MGKNVALTVMGRPNALFVENEDITTVKKAYEKLGLSGNHTATVNGEPAEMDDEIEDGAMVVFAKATKGGNN